MYGFNIFPKQNAIVNSWEGLYTIRLIILNEVELNLI